MEENLLSAGGLSVIPEKKVDVHWLTDAQLRAVIRELEEQTELLSFENAVLELHLARNTGTKPVSVAFKTVMQAASAASKLFDTTDSGKGINLNLDDEIASAFQSAAETLRSAGSGLSLVNASGQVAGSFRKRKSEKNRTRLGASGGSWHNSGHAFGLGEEGISVEQKTEIMTRESEELKSTEHQSASSWEQTLANLSAEMSQLEIGLQEKKKAAADFKRNVVQCAASGRTGKVMAEKVLRHFEETMRARDTFLGKMRLKNSTLKAQCNKLMLQLKQKEEMGEVLHAIDFDQLKIENQQYATRIEERNRELFKLKKNASKLTVNVNNHRATILELRNRCHKLTREISTLQEHIADQQLCALQASSTYDQDIEVFHRLRDLTKEKIVPSVLDYIAVKHSEQKALENFKSWKRKHEVAQVCLRRPNRIAEPRTSHRTPQQQHQQAPPGDNAKKPSDRLLRLQSSFGASQRQNLSPKKTRL